MFWQLDSHTRIVLGEAAAPPAARAAVYLQAQVAARTGLHWEIVRGVPPGPGDISLGVPGDGSTVSPLMPEHPEEIAIWCVPSSDGSSAAHAHVGAVGAVGAAGNAASHNAPHIAIRAGSPGAIMAATGRFARALHLAPGNARIGRTGLRERPAFPVRGHCFANHKQTTTYDKWDLSHWEDSLSEIAAWGSNIAVLYPLHPARWYGVLPFGDGGEGAPWFVDAAREAEWQRQWTVNMQVPALCHELGMRYGMWMPTNDVFWEEIVRHPEITRYGGPYVCCAVPEARRRIRAIRERLFASLPHLDVLFLPSKDDGGCPGCEQCTPWGPVYLDLVQEQAAQARRYHPNCKVWLATQGLTAAETDGLLRWLDQERPEWVEGVAYGPYSELMTFAAPDEPGSAFTLERYAHSGLLTAGAARLRAAIPGQYRMVLYPDETHTFRCQYPVTGMDAAVQYVWQREDAPSPRPVEMAAIHASTSIPADGAVPYTEGSTDDVNKFVWSACMWAPSRTGQDVAAEYARWFFGADVAADATAAILATESILNRPLWGNTLVTEARARIDRVELSRPDLMENWRWLNVRLGVLMLEYIQQVLHRDRLLGKELRYRVAVWHSKPDPTPGLRQTMTYLARRLSESDALLDECVWTRDHLFAKQKVAVRAAVRLQRSYLTWDVLLQQWQEALVRLEAGEYQTFPEKRAALVLPLQAAENSVRMAGKGVPVVPPVQEFPWESGETQWAW